MVRREVTPPPRGAWRLAGPDRPRAEGVRSLVRRPERNRASSNDDLALADTVLTVPAQPRLLIAEPRPGRSDRRLWSGSRQAWPRRRPRFCAGGRQPAGDPRRSSSTSSSTSRRSLNPPTVFLAQIARSPSEHGPQPAAASFRRAECTEQELRTLHGRRHRLCRPAATQSTQLREGLDTCRT